MNLLGNKMFSFKRILYLLGALFFLYLTWGYVLLIKASSEALLAMQLAQPPIRLGQNLLPVPFGNKISEKHFKSLDVEDFPYFLPYHILMLPKTIGEDSDSGGLKVRSGAQEKAYEIFEYMLRNGFNINQVDHNGCNSLHLAIYYEEFEIVEYLIESGADPLLSNPTSEIEICTLRPIDLIE